MFHYFYKTDNILVRSGCYNQIPQAELINNRNLYLIVLEAEKSKIKALADSVSNEILLPGS